MKPPKIAKLAICGIVRDAAHGLERNIPVVRSLAARFADFRAVMIENDSKDGTKQELAEWMETDSGKVFAQMEDLGLGSSVPSAADAGGRNPFFTLARVGRLARLRNRYLDIVEEWTETGAFVPDYLMVIDMDIARFDADAAMTSFAPGRTWDAVCAFGYSTSPKLRRRYHDAFALTPWEERLEPQTERKIKRRSEAFGSLKPRDEWVRVASGFGGVAFYRYGALKGLRYADPPLPNDDPRVEAKCEHYSLCLGMIERGFDRIYLNPAMTLKYQDLTPGVIWRSLKLRLGLVWRAGFKA